MSARLSALRTSFVTVGVNIFHGFVCALHMLRQVAQLLGSDACTSHSLSQRGTLTTESLPKLHSVRSFEKTVGPKMFPAAISAA